MPVEEARSEETPYGRYVATSPRGTVRRPRETDDPDEAYADWPGEYVPVRLPWPPQR